MLTPLQDGDTPVPHRILLRQRADGGAYGRTGTRYEVLVAAYELIKLIKRVSEKTLDPLLVSCLWQAAGMYIDDVLIEVDGVRHYYEMKTGDEYWGRAEGTIRWSFEEQRAYDQRHETRAFYYLVLSHDVTYGRLEPTRDPSVNVPFFPNSERPTEINFKVAGFIETIVKLLPVADQQALFVKLKGSTRKYLEFDQNDVLLIFQQFQTAFEKLCAVRAETLDRILAFVSKNSSGLLTYKAQGFKKGVQDILDRIVGIKFVVCKGVVFFTSIEEIFGRAPIVLGDSSAGVFEDLVLDGYFSTAQELRDYMEDLMEDEDD